MLRTNKALTSHEIKYLPISKADLILALDRLTRFKYPGFKYRRVFGDLLSKYLISPKFSKLKLEKLDLQSYKTYVETVFNGSVAFHIKNEKFCEQISKLIQIEEKETYNLDEELNSLIGSKLDFDGVLNFLDENKKLAPNLKRLLVYKKFFERGNEIIDKKALREKYFLKFPVEKVVVCEGITEEILLPKFASKYGYDFNKFGVHLISAGGKNQVAKLYCELKDELKLPLFVLLDSDAVKTFSDINFVKRPCDKLHLIECGEFEDLFSPFLIKRTVNNRYKNLLQCTVSDFNSTAPMTKTLCEYYRLNNLGDFQKAEFAKEIAKNIKSGSDLSPEIINIIEEIKSL